jgi:hypothetical protein
MIRRDATRAEALAPCWTMFQHVANQSSGNATSSHGPPSFLSFAATGLRVATGSAANSSTSAALAALRFSHSKSLCMKTPHRGTNKLAAPSKNIDQSLGDKISGSSASDRSAALSFLHARACTISGWPADVRFTGNSGRRADEVADGPTPDIEVCISGRTS